MYTEDTPDSNSMGMVHTILTRVLRRRFHVIAYEKYESETAQILIERFVAKHPLLKPELIMVNDQPYGFKKLKKELLSLENYPIFFEIESSLDPDGARYIESFDLYSEVKTKINDKLGDVVKLASMFAKSVMVERLKRLTDTSYEIVVVYSNLNELFLDEYLEADLEEGLVTEVELESLFDGYINSFVYFIKAFDDIVTKGKSLTTIDLPVDIF